MIAFGTAVTDDRLYEEFGLAGIEPLAEEGALVMTRRDVSVQRAYNSMIAEAAEHDDLEALVLPHQDLRIVSADFNDVVREALTDESVAVIGCVGGQGVRGITWLDDCYVVGNISAQVGPAVLAFSTAPHSEPIEVDTVDGALIILSAWAVRNLQFDLRFEHDFHGYDTDICFQARFHGRRVVTANIHTVHDGFGKLGAKRGSWIRASLEFDRKWGGWMAATQADSEANHHRTAVWAGTARAGIQDAVRTELDNRGRAWPRPGSGTLPTRVPFDLHRPGRDHWSARMLQHVTDSYADVPMSKMPEDLRVYEHLMWLSRADTAIEIGSFCGGSALWLRDRLAAFNRYRKSPPPHVITIDRELSRVLPHLEAADPDYAETIDAVAGDVCDPELPERVARLLRPGSRCIVIEDSAHIYATTYAALDGFARFVDEGGFFVVEDTSCDVDALRLPMAPRGVLPALNDWLQTDAGADFVVRHDLELYGFSCHPGGFLQRRSSSGDGVGHP